MGKWLLRLSSFVFTAVVCHCALLVLANYQKSVPLGADISFQLNTSAATIEKSELALELSEIGKSLNTMICKVAPNVNSYLIQRDIILFSGTTQATYGPYIDKESIYWLNQDITGSLIKASNLEDRSLSGTYYATDIQNLREQIDAWSASRSISIEWLSASKGAVPWLILQKMTNASTSLLICASFLLILASVACALLRAQHRNRIMLLGGSSLHQVQLTNMAQTFFPLFDGMAFGLACFAIYLLVLPQGVAQLKIYIQAASLAIACHCLFATFAAILFSGICVPHMSNLAARYPVTMLKYSGPLLTIASLAVCIIALIQTTALAKMQVEYLNQASAYENLATATRISLKSMPAIENDGDSMQNSLTSLILEAEEGGICLVSLDVNQSMSIGPEELGNHDHLVIVNEAYLNRLDIAIGHNSSGGSLDPIGESDVSHFAAEMASAWSDGAGSDAYGFYQYQGAGLLALGQGTAYGGENVVCKNPLVLVIKSSLADWNYSGFVEPLLSTGNAFFTDGEQLRRIVVDANVSEYIASIDNLFEKTLQNIQGVIATLNVRIATIVVATCVIISMGIQSAMSWAMLRRRLIFALRSNGNSYLRISAGSLRNHLIAAGVVLLVWIIAQLAFRAFARTTAHDNICPVTIALIFYLGSQLVTRAHFALTSFAATSARKGA